MRTPSRLSRLAGPLAVTMTAVIALAGCAGGAKTVDTAGSADQSPTSVLIPAAEGKVDYPVTLKTAWGEVTIEKRPERIVAGSWRGDLSWLLALGVTPVAVESAEWAMEAVPWAKESLAEPIEHTWTSDDLALEPEAIAAATPDLIVAGSLGAERVPNLDQLTTVAPVLAQPDTGTEAAGWRANLLQIGEALDLKDRAEKVIADYDAFFADFRTKHPEFSGRSIAFLGFHGQNDVWYGNSTGSVFEEFFTRQGFAPNADTALDDAEALSPELIGKISADLLVAVDYSPPEDKGREFANLVKSPLFRSLGAVKSGRVLLLSSPARTVLYRDGKEVGPIAHPSVAYDDPIGSPKLAELLAPLLSETLGS